MGNSLIMPSFVAIIVGGVGSLPGAVLGGLIIGIAAGITTTYYPAASEAVIYLMMLIVLAIRPRGLLGEEGLFE
jgi:branched-chain amino acid transport system permease protein